LNQSSNSLVVGLVKVTIVAEKEVFNFNGENDERSGQNKIATGLANYTSKRYLNLNSQ